MSIESETESLDEILSDVDASASHADQAPVAETPEPVTADAEETTASAEESTESTGEENTAETAADTSPVSEEAQDDDSDLAAMRAELARVRQQKRDLQQQLEAGQQEQPEPVDFFQDPEGRVAQIQQDVQSDFTRKLINMSEYRAKQVHEDFDEMSSTFSELANQDPRLWGQMAEHPDPAEFAYQVAKRHEKMKQIGDIDTFEERIRAEEQKKAQAQLDEMKKRLDQLEALGSTPASLSDKRAAGVTRTSDDTDDTLDSILGR